MYSQVVIIVNPEGDQDLHVSPWRGLFCVYICAYIYSFSKKLYIYLHFK